MNPIDTLVELDAVNTKLKDIQTSISQTEKERQLRETKESLRLRELAHNTSRRDNLQSEIKKKDVEIRTLRSQLQQVSKTPHLGSQGTSLSRKLKFAEELKGTFQSKLEAVELRILELESQAVPNLVALQTEAVTKLKDLSSARESLLSQYSQILTDKPIPAVIESEYRRISSKLITGVAIITSQSIPPGKFCTGCGMRIAHQIYNELVCGEIRNCANCLRFLKIPTEPTK